MIRKPYLISQAIKTYIFASILTMAIGQLNALVDSLLMGHLIGPEALSAIMLSFPVLNLATIAYILLSSGAAMMAGKAIGARDYEKSSNIFSVSIMSLLIVGIMVAFGCWLFRGELTAYICTDKRLFPYVLQYLGCATGLSFFTMISQALSQFMDVDGKPRTVTRAMAISVSVNIVFNIFFVAICKFGITGSALASVCGSMASIVFLVLCMTRDNKSYHFKVHVPNAIKILGENVKNGFSMMITTVLVAICFIYMNSMVVKSLGADGMFVMSITGGLMGICSLLTTGASQTFTSVGGMLFGQNDFRGMRILFSKCVVIVLLAALFMTLAGQIWPEGFAILYGAKTPELIMFSIRGLRIMTLMFIPFTLLVMMPPVYQLLGHLKLVGLMAVSYYSILLPLMTLLGKSSNPENIWNSFPLAAWGGLALCMLVLFFIHRKNPDTMPLVLIPDPNPYHRMLDISIPARQDSVNKAMEEVSEFVESLDINSKSLKNNIELCTEELLENIVHHSGIPSSHYIDLRITETDTIITVMLKDDGLQFDPTILNSAKTELGLTLARALSNKMEYKYMYSLNMTFMEWNKEDSKNKYIRSSIIVPEKLL